MGLGAAASEPGTLSMIRQLTPMSEAATAHWCLGRGSGFSLALGPVLGGALSWRGAGGDLLVRRRLRSGRACRRRRGPARERQPGSGPGRRAGTLLGAGALAALIFGVINGETAGFTAPSVLALFCVCVVAAVSFVLREHHAPHPLLDLSYLRVPQFTTANVVAYCTYFATFAIFLLRRCT